jgi:hypothetical protein
VREIARREKNDEGTCHHAVGLAATASSSIRRVSSSIRRVIMRIKTSVAVIALMLAAVVSGHAAILYSSPLYAYTTNRRLACSLVNVSNEAKDATFWIIRHDGAILSTYQYSGASAIRPGQSRGIAPTPTAHAAGYFCKVQAAGVKSDWRDGFTVLTWVTGRSEYETRASVPLE